MKTEQQLKDTIMQRIWTAYFIRQATQPMVVGVALIVSLFALGRLVFVAKVLENASLQHDAIGYVAYLLNAFVGTQFIVQLVVVLSGTLFAFMLKDALSLFSKSRLAGV